MTGGTAIDLILILILLFIFGINHRGTIMSHYTQRQFVEWVKAAFPDSFKGKRVLEVGSLDINGSVRGYFQDCEYIGLDVGPGPGVDVVCGGQEYDAPSGSFEGSSKVRIRSRW